MRYIVGFLIGIGLIVLTFILIIRIFSGGGDNGQQQRKIDLNSYATTDTVMRLTMDGPIVADPRHQQVRITVGRDNVLYERFQGYQGDIVDSKQYANNPDAYAEFLHALSVAGYTLGDPQAPKDERGYCPAGYRFVYEAIGEGENIVRWWNTSCGANQGNFEGNAASVRDLFKRQVPDYREVTKGTIFAG